jgi:hypothetical protein
VNEIGRTPRRAVKIRFINWIGTAIRKEGETMKTVQKMNTDELTALLRSDNAAFKASLSIKSREELLLLLGNIVDALDIGGKGYVNQFEDYLRRILRYKRSAALGDN